MAYVYEWKAGKAATKAELISQIALHKELTGRADLPMFAAETRFSSRIGRSAFSNMPVVVGKLITPSVCDRYVADMEAP